MKNTRVARRYAKGLMAVAEESKTLDRISTDLDLIHQILKDSREFRLLLSSPIISAEKKKSVLSELLGSRVSQGTMTLLNLLTAKGREALLGDLVEEFHALRDERLGIINVDVKTAVEFTPPQEKSLQDQLEQYTQKKVRVRFSVDKAIRGGLVVQIGDTVLDASIKRQLELLRERLAEGGPLSN